jgi:hypothetical protein
MHEQVQQIVEWYRLQARPFLAKLQPEKVADFDKDCARLEAAAASLNEELPVCFLGNSGVGKSTLINALVAGGGHLVPSGGVGPLTAQALTVRYGEDPKLEVEYFPPQKLWNLVFGLESAFKAQLGTPKLQAEAPPLEEAEAPEPEGRAEERSTPDESRERDRHDRCKLAQLLVTGNQNLQIPLGYLLDSLRDALGYSRIWGTEPEERDAPRIRRIREALTISKANRSYTLTQAMDSTQFTSELKDHASGFLAPLIKTLTIWWNSKLLADGVTLIDLPGLGIVGDPRPEITRNYIREKARAIVLVVDRAGITEPVARLLRESEFLPRLLHSADEPEGDPVLLVAVTHMDDVADEEYMNDGDLSGAEHFADVCTQMTPLVSGQLRGEIERVWQQGGELDSAKQQVIDNILRTLQVHPLSAVEYRKMLLGKKTSLLDTPEETNVPAMIESLGSLRRAQYDAQLAKVQAYRDVLLQGALSAIRLIEAQWEDEHRREEEVAQLRMDLENFIEPLRKEFHVRQGQYRGFLKKQIPNRLVDLVALSKEKARNKIQKYLSRLGESHWATLRASVRRGGRFSGASEIDLQREFALRFEEPIAEAWGREILKDIRKETRDYAAASLEMVDQVAEWAHDQGARVQQKVVDAQCEAIRNDAKKLEAVGREMIKEVRDKNASLLIDTIDGPIRRKCRKFVDENGDVGPGVKNRILMVYDKLADEVVDAAEKPAIRILTELFQEVETEILDAFSGHQNPLDAISEAIVDSQQKYLDRSDKQKRARVLNEIHDVLSSLPKDKFIGAGA